MAGMYLTGKDCYEECFLAHYMIKGNPIINN
jgi:hypothetical protein